MGNTALDAALNAQFLVQIGVFTAVPMIIGFILELGLMQVCLAFMFYSEMFFPLLYVESVNLMMWLVCILPK